MQKEIKSNEQLKTLLFLQLELQELEKVYSVFSDFLFIIAKYTFLFETSPTETSLSQSTSTPSDTSFSTQDPARDGGNWWNYCNSNPILRVDRTGFDDYIFYNFDDFSEQASREYEKLVNARNGDESKVHLVSTKTAEKFKTDWENMSNPETITMIFHGNETGITLNYEDPYSDMNGFLTSNENGITKNGNKALRIQDLKTFDITTLKLFSCQSGNINEGNNLAITFQQNMNINKVIASDGNLSFTKTGDPKVSHKGSKEYREKYSEKPAGLVTFQEKENKKTGKKENVVKEIVNFKDFFVDLIN